MSIRRSKPATTTLRQLRASARSSVALNSGIGTRAGGGSRNPVQTKAQINDTCTGNENS
jgi:hypothetical protein